MSGDKGSGLVLPEEVKRRVDNALVDGKPIVVSAVTPDGKPTLSFRGSTHVHSPDQLAIWARNPGGEFINGIATNPQVALLYRDPEARTTYIFNGRARVDGDEAVRTAVYEGSPKAEQDRDPERKGVAVIVDLDTVRGGTVGGDQVNLSRA